MARDNINFGNGGGKKHGAKTTGIVRPGHKMERSLRYVYKK